MAKTQDDYNMLADDFDLVYLGPGDPPGVSQRVPWRCNNCYREFERSYRQLRRRQVEGKPGCRCHGKQALKRSHYESLAKRLGLIWSDNHLPPTTRSETTWYWPDHNRTFRATYHQIREGIPPSLSHDILDYR
jgi:hypothetical protein